MPDIELTSAELEEALTELETHQTQLDMDGIMVGVSRQALDMVITTARAGLEAGKAGESMHEPRAWEGWWDGAGSVDSFTRVTRLRSTMEEWKAEGAEITPLFAIRALPLTGAKP